MSHHDEATNRWQLLKETSQQTTETEQIDSVDPIEPT